MMSNLYEWCKENNKESLLDEWDYEKNELMPSDYSPGSNKIVYWKCSKGHKWHEAVYLRKTSGCPYCANRRVWQGYNDLATKYPDIAKEWDYSKNGDLKPEDVVAGSGKRVWWKCPQGHSFATSISNRTSQNTGCAVCSGKKMLKGYNDLKTLNPPYLSEWDYEKNVDVSPDEVSLFSHKKIWWRCNNCNNSWRVDVSNRSSGHGCPKCSTQERQAKRYKTLLKEGVSLAEHNPELVEEWDYDKNNELGVTPDGVLARSNLVVWWRCKKCNNHWKAMINSRSKGVGCPVCGRIKAKENALKTLIEERGSLGDSDSPLLKEWDYEKNIDITPYDVMPGSNNKVWWKCPTCGHSWMNSIAARKGKGCPRCTKELRSSFQEQAIYYYISKIYPDAINGYRDLGYELDIFIPSEKIAIEYDGGAWHKDIIRDLLKNEQCHNDDIFLYRVREEKCPHMDNTDHLVCYEYKTSRNNLALNGIIKDLCYRISGKEIDVDIDNDNTEILNQFVLGKKKNNLESLYPDIAKEWDTKKNKDVTPSMIMPKTGRKFWWICSKGHSYIATPNDRVRIGRGCPYCANQKLLVGYNDLETLYPNVAAEWNYTKNTKTPHDVVFGTNKKVWWKCKEGHEWQAEVKRRVEGTGCPYCSGRIAIKGKNDLTITNPELSKEWNYSKNPDLPSDYKAGSNIKVWWKCSEGHEWQAQISSRSSGRGCPFCTGRKVLVGFNDLVSQKPLIASEWCYEKNGDLKPEDFSCGSGRKVWWRCNSCGNEWESTIGERAKNERGCPICSGNKNRMIQHKRHLKEKGSLIDVSPSFLEDWNYLKNDELGLCPKDFTCGSNQKVWWKCSTCGYEWITTIASRNQGHGCSVCNHKSAVKKRVARQA